jgi:predicted NAD/FAD-dependent oxidoreductase
MEEERRSVVVIGAGLAGLRCAQLLKPHYPDVLVVEASTEGIGGRVRQVSEARQHSGAPRRAAASPRATRGRSFTHPSPL